MSNVCIIGKLLIELLCLHNGIYDYPNSCDLTM